MDTSEMRELLEGYLTEMDWSGGASRDDIVAHLAGRDDALRTMVNAYVADGTYPDADHVLTLIPIQAWQDVQGDRWQGAEIGEGGDVPSHFRDGPAGQDTASSSGGQSSPSTPGFGSTRSGG